MSILTKLAVTCLAFMVFVCGCSPMGTAVKIGVHVVGKVVDDAETDKLGDQLLGRNAAQADSVLGPPVDVYADVSSSRQWRTYPVPIDLLNSQRYVVEVVNDRIVLIKKVKMDSGKVDIALALIYHEKLKGKSPSECEADLKMGAPLLVLRNSAGQMTQIYDARLIKELPKPHYCIVRYDTEGQCDRVKLAEIAATAGQS